MFKNIILVYILLTVSTVFTYGQNIYEQKFKLAESYELNGDFEKALRIYTELMNEKPNSDLYFNGYVRVMKSMNKYSEMLPVVLERLQKNQTLNLLDLYAELNWRTGKPDAANSNWEKALNEYPDSPTTYEFIAQTQVNLRLFDKAIATLLKGRDKFNDPVLFSDLLIRLYIATGDYQNGTKEILNLLNKDFNMPQAQGRLYALMINQTAKEYIGDELKRISGRYQDNIAIQEVYAWYLKTTEKSDEALELVIRIDEMKKTNGLEIVNFASSASRDGDYETALKAYRIIVNKGKSNPYASTALFGFTRALEQKMQLDKKKFDQDAVEDIIDSYKKILKEYPRTPNAADSRLRLAGIYYTYLGDTENAIDELEALLKEFSSSQYSVSAYLELGKIYIINGDLEKAEESFAKIQQLNRFASAEQKDIALYNTALLKYFKGEIEKAKAAFSELSNNPNSDIANDVIRKIYIISSNEEKVAALDLYAKAEYKEFQKKPDEAVKLLKEAARLSGNSMLGEMALLKAAEIEFDRGNYSSSREFITELNKIFPESKNIDQRIMLTAETFYYENNMSDALKYYTELITKYPASIHIQEARKKIRIIRKDKI